MNKYNFVNSNNAGIITKIFSIFLAILLVITLFRILAGIDNGGMTFTEMETRARIVDRERDQNSYFAMLHLGF